VCRGSDAKYYNEGLRYQLARLGVPHRVSGEVVCVSARRASDLRAAEMELERTFPQVAELLKDECEERAFVAWATREKLRFDVRESTSGHRLFLLRSFNKEELADNMRRLTKEAPKGASCPKGEPK
jgi:hypothetical protein